jgi:hypothetical protein
MNWEAIGAISELIGAAAVVATLLYLVKQIKQNTESTDAVGLQTWQSNSSAHWLSMAENPELARAVTTSIYDSRDLSDDNWIQAGCWWLNNFRQYQTTFIMHERGVVDDELFVVEMRMAARNLKAPGIRQWWDVGGKNQMIPRFVKCLEEFDPGEDSNWAWTKETGFVSVDQIEGWSIDKP